MQYTMLGCRHGILWRGLASFSICHGRRRRGLESHGHPRLYHGDYEYDYVTNNDSKPTYQVYNFTFRNWMSPTKSSVPWLITSQTPAQVSTSRGDTSSTEIPVTSTNNPNSGPSIVITDTSLPTSNFSWTYPTMSSFVGFTVLRSSETTYSTLVSLNSLTKNHEVL